MAKRYVTINDIAKATGVSKTTVSRYLNGRFERMSEKTRAKIAAAIKESGYRANPQAQALTQQKSSLIGMVVADIENIFSSMLFKGADQILRQHGYSIMLMNADNSSLNEQTQLQRLLDLRVDGLILQPMNRELNEYQQLQNSQLPVIIVDRKLSPAAWPEVVTQNFEYSKMLTSYMIRQQYEQIVVLTESVHANSAREERYRGVLAAAEQTGTKIRLLEVAEKEMTSSLYAKLAEIDNLLTSKTAVYALKGTLLTQLMRTLAEYNVKVPDELGVAAFDDWDWASLMSPQITTIQQDPQSIGQVAAELMLQQLNGEKVPQLTTVASRFTVRKSL